MKDSDLQRIQHIKTYCEKAAKTLNRYGLEYEIFVDDEDYRNSISMYIMQIGELSGGLSAEFKESSKNQMPWGMIKGMRNIVAHAYASMDIEVVWEVVTCDLPVLLRFCDDILSYEKP
jgi:uncharacterized protein with HEPN domain